MREILFRGKCDNEEWLEGIAFPYDRDKVTMFSQHPIDGSLFGIEVIPETVGQYTGLTDKNGKKIFEGDIVRIYYPFDAPDDCVVYWLNESAKWNLPGCDGYFCTASKNCEIIGNIYDNPELLER